MVGQIKSVKLTKAIVDGLKPREVAYVAYDEKLTGFGVRVNPTGKKAWLIEYRHGGRASQVRRLTFARVGELTPDEARERARRLLAGVRDGFDPIEERTEQRTAPTLNELAERWLAEHVQPKRKARTAEEYAALLKRCVLPSLGQRKAREIKRTDIIKLHHAMRDRPYQANRMLATLGSLFNWAMALGHVPEGQSPATRIARHPEKKRETYLSGEELVRLGETLRLAETEGLPWDTGDAGQRSKHGRKPGGRRTLSPFVVAAVRLLLLTGCRRNEILNLRWSEVDFERRRLHLSDSKTGRKSVALSPQALAILTELPRASAFVVAGGDPTKPRPDLNKAWDTIRQHAGIPEVRLHDLRHTYAAEAAGGGLSLPMIGRLLGHTQAATTHRYAHLADDPLDRAAEHVGSRLAAQLSGSAGASVVPLRRIVG